MCAFRWGRDEDWVQGLSTMMTMGHAIEYHEAFAQSEFTLISHSLFGFHKLVPFVHPQHLHTLSGYRNNDLVGNKQEVECTYLDGL